MPILQLLLLSMPAQQIRRNGSRAVELVWTSQHAVPNDKKRRLDNRGRLGTVFRHRIIRRGLDLK